MITDNWIELKEYISRFKKILRINTIISTDVFVSCVLDPSYLHHLIIGKNIEYYFNILLNTPPVKFKDYNNENPNNKIIFLKKAHNLIEELEKNKHHELTKKKYKKQFGDFFKYERTKSTSKCNKCLDIDPLDFRKVYLDYNATTDLRPEVKKVLQNFIKNKYGFENPSSNTAQGQYLRELIFEAKQQISSDLFVKPENIIFTGSGSEANNLAIKGIAFRRLQEKGHIITSKVEHASILETMNFLSDIGFEITYLDVDKEGLVCPQSVKKNIKKNTFLVSIMAVNNEIGSINPIKEIGTICLEHNICFMVDAIQAFGKMIIDPEKSGISLLSFSGHKIYAPKGIGGLYIKEGLQLTPQIHGGGQEFGLRSGTENISSILALAKASKLAHNEMAYENNRLKELREYFLNMLIQIEPKVIINGSISKCISNNLNIGFPKVDSGSLLKNLNKLGINVSPSSSCSSRKNETSHVLKAIGADTKNYGSIRFSFGLSTTKEDLDYVIQQLHLIIPLLKKGATIEAV
ncbi:cysteine desulfurase family protein [Paenibacillus polymyxa]|uniref:cysteine desulfurase family protein n=1 Tax=Paenibacillus polymyxa TaxID=1406 RepID=UPI002025107A|nr:cysteine desulfurase family protein [Paenibacillus polymyxa]URJ43646.3 cysteine desulfurase family protein [Paenibacillus polymyxa]